MADLSYSVGGLYTAFYSNTPDGHRAWCKLARQTEGTGKVLTIHAKATISQLREAGYTVAPEKPSRLSDDELIELLAE